jgi:hypothetical protein
MEPAMTKELEQLKKYLRLEESQILARALRLGVRQLWRKAVLDEYAAGRISKRKATALLGTDLVRRLDEEKRFILKDTRWGLSDD